MEKYELTELKNPNIVVFIPSLEDWKKLKKTKILNMTKKYYGPYCYNMTIGTYCTMSSKKNSGKFENVTIVQCNEINFDQFFFKKLPEKWFYCYKNREEFEVGNSYFKRNWSYNPPNENSGVCNDPGSNYWGGRNKISLGYKEITFQEFEKYILNEKKKSNFLPEKWCVKVKEHNQPAIVRQWRERLLTNNGSWLDEGYIHCDGYHSHTIRYDYIEISLKTFKKHVLKI